MRYPGLVTQGPVRPKVSHQPRNRYGSGNSNLQFRLERQRRCEPVAGFPHDGEVGQGGDFKTARQFAEGALLPARATQGEGPLQRWWLYQDAPEGRTCGL